MRWVNRDIVPRRVPGGRWTQFEERHLRENYTGGESLEKIAEVLGRTKLACANKVQQLKLGSRPVPKAREPRFQNSNSGAPYVAPAPYTGRGAGA